ncbi:YafY family protein [Streptomyces sp. TLI_146]|uniref:helix-turn-helix transcriptional regulator n=1 Tax=Streptomyces sp. TLI_146 TaxID=1938858 RepID=UPI000C6FD20D|nr:WYL domain-containing protein [Streptomyces sp. TLI_146]PKV89318.1 putative DNA-binding transcriptional regulator YafY [Streptomyces sp. TLI_146]
MRADRLVATLLFLQTRGRVTAREVAAELEVSERTARRDLEALAAAGIPVYSQHGRGGGWSLVGGARTDLTGLTAAEIRAMFLVAGPSAATPELRTALRKLVRALPAPLRPDAEAASKAGVTDGTDWWRLPVTAGTPQLDALQGAVVDGLRIRLGYARPGSPAGMRTVDPLGLVTKAGVPYLVAGTDKGGGEQPVAGSGHDGLRIFRLDRITSVEVTADPVVRPEGFDLASAWRALAAPMEERMRGATVRGRADPTAGRVLAVLFGGRLRLGGERADGWLEMEIDGPSPEVVAAQLAGLGARVEVLEPPEARERLAELGAELAGLYGEG